MQRAEVRVETDRAVRAHLSCRVRRLFVVRLQHGQLGQLVGLEHWIAALSCSLAWLVLASLHGQPFACETPASPANRAKGDVSGGARTAAGRGADRARGRTDKIGPTRLASILSHGHRTAGKGPHRRVA